MIELFPNIPMYLREQAKIWFDLAIRQNPANAADTLIKFRELCKTDEEKDFADFYFKLRMEELKKGENND